eukprot:TRINITY_DN74012_c0_g1_i1.p1 TRINITY_DN74012_c0_g1~~TRINITY_DN74012_c0_g1_i1.p1  ORF type:complete len:646 (-),score=197.87 TRINITY_DN74012_c0_g1_i1:121-2004(-)
MQSAECEKKIKAVKKKLGQIEKLKEKSSSDLDAAAREKIESEATLRQELASLEAEKWGDSAPASEPTPPPAPAKKAAPPPAQDQEETPEPASKGKSKKKAVKEIVPVEEAEPPKQVEVAVAAPAAPTGPSPEQEKRLKNLRKKIQQIDKLKGRSGTLDPEAQEKVASEAEILREIAALEKGEEFVPLEKEQEAAPAPSQEPAPSAAEDRDPHAAAREKVLRPPPADLGLLLDNETEKKFKSLQKTLRDIGKLHEKENPDKLQLEKIGREPGVIEELEAIFAKAEAAVESRRAKYNPPSRKGKESESGEGAEPEDGAKEANAESEGEEQEVAQKPKTYESSDLKTNRRKKGAVALKKLDDTVIDSKLAKWAEVKEVLESGEGGTDKGRQKKAIVVDRKEPASGYDNFDTALLRCGFLTRVELSLPPGVLMQEDFQLYFPGSLTDSLLELLLKGNNMPSIPPGLGTLTRIRSVDLSHNSITELLDADAWKNLAGSLEMLDLSFNKLTTIEELAPLTKLSSLKIDGNQVESLDGISWGNLKQLASVTAVGNRITVIPEEVAERGDTLERLELAENGITTVPVELVELKKLKWFTLGGNPIKDQKVVNNLSKGIKDLKAYLSKIGSKGKKK